MDLPHCRLLLGDEGSSPRTSTNVIVTRTLSDESSGDVNPGAFAVVGVESVLSNGVRAISNKPGLWTGLGRMLPQELLNRFSFGLFVSAFSWGFWAIPKTGTCSVTTRHVIIAGEITK